MQENVESFRLSPQQTRLWLLQQRGTAFRGQCAVLVEGPLDFEALKGALLRVVERYEIFRTTFQRSPGLKVATQVIADAAPPAWQTADMSGSGPERQRELVEEFFEEEGGRGFDFERGPLLRPSLLKLAPERHVLIVGLPALCADATTLQNLVAEVASFYVSGGAAPAPSDEPLQYADFSAWQHELLEGAEAAAGKEFWQRQDPSTFSALTLPFESSPFDDSEFEPGRLAVELGGESLAALLSAAGRQEVRPADYLLACWQTLLWRVTEQPEIVVGHSCDGRKYEEVGRAMGLFARWLPVRCRFEAGYRFAEILEQVCGEMRAADEWQEYFTWEQKAGGNGRELAYFPAGFEYERWPEPLAADGLRLTHLRREVCFERYRVKLRAVESEGGLRLEFHYDAGQVRRESVAHLAGQLTTLIESAARDPRTPVGELEILSPEERGLVLDRFNETRRDYPRGLCVQELFERQAGRTPEAAAVAYEGGRLSYAELNERANLLAHFLRERGVGPDVPVAICAERSLEMVVGMLGVLKAGGAYVPIEPAQPRERLGHILSDVGSPLLLTQQRLLQGLPEHGGSNVCLDADWGEIARGPRDNPRPLAAEANLAYVIFTSGSTGRPKGVCVEHRQLVNYVYAAAERLDLRSPGNCATVSTFAADLGHTMIFPALSFGGCLHVISQERASDPEALADYFGRNEVDCLKIVPSHLDALLNYTAPERLLPRRRLVLGGESSRWELLEKVRRLRPECEVFNHYGPTETTVGVVAHRLEGGERAERTPTVPLGRPVGNARVYLLDAGLRPVLVGASGELHIAGAGVARGYLGQPALTAERFIPDPYGGEPGARMYKSGDLARYRPDGQIEFLGRADNQIKFHGHRVELNEIRAALNRHPLVRDSVVTLCQDGQGRANIVAYYVSRQEVEVASLREFLLGSIIEETLPNLFVHLKKLPLTLNGKINYRALPSLEEARRRVKRTFVEPRTETERTVAAVCAGVLGLERVGVEDNFFELGGHSLLATRVITLLREEFQVELPLRTLFEEPTVAGLALAITRAQLEQEDAEEVARMVDEVRLMSGPQLQEALGTELLSPEGTPSK